jgi:hypothetical protein
MRVLRLTLYLAKRKRQDTATTGARKSSRMTRAGGPQRAHQEEREEVESEEESGNEGGN